MQVVSYLLVNIYGDVIYVIGKLVSKIYCYLVKREFRAFWSLNIILYFLTININSLSGQSSASLVPHIPTSPQAAAFAQFGEHAVNPSTGIPDISIPLFELEHRGYKIPVVLKYNPRPLKAGYNYDVLGYGWGLSVNGVISRSIEYQPDEWKDFQLEMPSDGYLNTCSNCIYNGNYAHDKFQAVLPNGSSFDFIIDKQNGKRVFLVSDDRNVKINCGASNNQILWFTLVDEDGVKYTFDGADTPYPGTGTYYNAYVSWQLSRIDLPNSPEPILFSYPYTMSSSYYTSCPEPVVQFKHYFEPGIPSINPHTYHGIKYTEGTAASYNMRLLGAISYGPEGKSRLILTYKNNNHSQHNYLEKVMLMDNGRVINEVRLDMSVRTVGGLCSGPLARLDSIGVYGSKNNVLPAYRYRFEYASGPFSFNGTDHWGNWNYSSYSDMPNFNLFTEWHTMPMTELHNAGMVERTKLQSDVSPLRKFSLSNQTSSDSKRAMYPEQHGILKKIIYPTGGYTIFQFENHQFYTHTSAAGDYIHNRSNREIKEGGGFRVRTIETYDADGARTGKKNFRYGKTNSERGILAYPHQHNGAGEPVVDPNILTYLNFSSFKVNYSIKNMILGVNPMGQHQQFPNPFGDIYYQNNSWYWLCNFSALNFRRVLGGRPTVLYSNVTVYEGDINESTGVFPMGKTVYEYDIGGYYPGEYIFETPQYFGNMLGYVAKDFRYNRLVRKTDYKYDSTTSSFIKVRKESNSWSWHYQSSYDYQFSNTYPEEHRPSWITVGSLFTGKPFYIGSGRISSQSVTDFFAPGDSIVTSKSYDYNGRGQVTRTSVSGGTSGSLSTSRVYPISETENTSQVIQSLVDKNMISPILNTLTYMPSFSQSLYEQRAGTKIEYGIFNTDQLLPARQYALEFSPTSEKYTLKSEVLKYSQNGNPLEVLQKGNHYTGYVWGYGDRYPVAEVQNARLLDVAYTGFETSETGGWSYNGVPATTYARTGEFGYQLSPGSGLSRTGLVPGRRYRVSVCVYGNTAPIFTGGTAISSFSESLGNNWSLYHFIFDSNGSIHINPPAAGSMWIDDVRLCPLGAKMTTYTYQPLVGITSVTDSRGITEYYEYDRLGRLSAIKDSEGNILKTHCYNYAGQQIDCF